MATAADALRKLTSGQTLTAEENKLLGIGTTSAPKTISQMTKEEIDAATAKTIASGGKSVGVGIGASNTIDRLPGESFAEANARISAGYKTMTAKPVPSADQTAAGMKVQYVRTEAGGVGEYTTTVPSGYTGNRTVRTWTSGIIPSNVKYTTGTSVGTNVKTNVSTSTKTITGKVTNSDGSVTTFYSDGSSTITPAVVNSSGNNNGSSNTGSSNTGSSDFSSTGTGAPTTNIEILKATLRGLGYNPKLIDSSASYLQQLLKEGLDYDNATEVFLNTKEYTLKNGTKITSPFYAAYGFLNESAKTPRSASELYGFVEGTKALVEKYGLNTKFMSEDSLKKYVGNGVTVADLEERANTARLKALESDTSYVEALKKLGFIGAASDLTDFYLDPNIGKSTLEENRRTGLFASEALRRAAQGVSMDAQFAKQVTAGLTAKGLTEAQIQATAAEGYANIAENLGTTTKLSGIYDKSAALTQAQVQSELQQEEFMGMASAARKRTKEMETRAFEAAPGIGRYGLSQRGAAGLI